jgi:hypothetical protein
MSETPATHLARLRVQYGSRFRIERNAGRFTARERVSGQTITPAAQMSLKGSSSSGWLSKA